MRLVLATLALALVVACHDETRFFGELPEDVQANVAAVADGQRLYMWMNCAGCHGQGGGGLGPPLMDERWIYGSSLGEIHTSIALGRPNGMPPFAGRMSDDDMWKVAAYVRTLSGNGRRTMAPGRSDHMHAKPPGPSQEREEPTR